MLVETENWKILELLKIWTSKAFCQEEPLECFLNFLLSKRCLLCISKLIKTSSKKLLLADPTWPLLLFCTFWFPTIMSSYLMYYLVWWVFSVVDSDEYSEAAMSSKEISHFFSDPHRNHDSLKSIDWAPFPVHPWAHSLNWKLVTWHVLTL